MYTQDEEYKQYLEFKQKKELLELLEKYGFEDRLDDILNSDLINKKRLLEDGVVEYKLQELLEDGYIINNMGEITPPLFCLSDLSEEIGWDRKKAAVYKKRKKYFLPPSAIVNGRHYWSANQVRKMTNRTELTIMEKRRKQSNDEKK